MRASAEGIRQAGYRETAQEHFGLSEVTDRYDPPRTAARGVAAVAGVVISQPQRDIRRPAGVVPFWIRSTLDDVNELLWDWHSATISKIATGGNQTGFRLRVPDWIDRSADSDRY